MPKLIDHQEVQEKICQLLTEGHSLHAIVKMDGMPTKTTVLRWLKENPAFCVQYAHAREGQSELMADKMVEIALDPPKNADPQLLRVQMDAIKWAAGKMRPLKYGEPNLLKKMVDHEFERKMIDITPDKGEEEVQLLDKKQLARAVWAALYNPDKEKA